MGKRKKVESGLRVDANLRRLRAVMYVCSCGPWSSASSRLSRISSNWIASLELAGLFAHMHTEVRRLESLPDGLNILLSQVES